MKRCARCQKEKPLDAFSRGRGRPASWCKECSAEHARAWYEANREKVLADRKVWYEANRERINAKQREYRRLNPERKRAYRLKYEFGITVEDYNRMVEDQGGNCAICLLPPAGTGRNTQRLHIDHDHETGEIRGLLCHACNTSLGQLAEDHERMQRMIDYVTKHNGRRDASP
jgi:hypothetical protein